MKRISFLFIVLLTVGTVAMAQGNHRRGRAQKERTPQEHAERMTERMVKEYSLNDKQKAKLLELNLSMAEKMKAEMPQRAEAGKHPRKHRNAEPGKCTCPCETKRQAEEPAARRPQMKPERTAERRQAMKESHETYNAGLKEIMTKKQYAAYTKKQEARAEKMKEMRMKRVENSEKTVSKI